MTRFDLPTISLITPSFNQAKFVQSTIRSVLRQRYPKMEYLFMDGGSTDGTLEVVKEYIPQFSHFETGPDGGQSAAISKGLKISRGQIMAYLNSDDVLLPGTLNFVADYFNRYPDIDLIYGHRCIIDDNSNVMGHWILPPHQDFLMKRWDLIPQETCFWRRRIFERAGNIDSSFRFAMDYDFLVRVMQSGRVRRVNRFLAAFRVHPGAKTSTQLASTGKAEIKRIQKKYRLIMPPLVGDIFSLSVQVRSALWVKYRKCLPGLPPGIGYNIESLWSE